MIGFPYSVKTGAQLFTKLPRGREGFADLKLLCCNHQPDAVCDMICGVLHQMKLNVAEVDSKWFAQPEKKYCTIKKADPTFNDER